METPLEIAYKLVKDYLTYDVFRQCIEKYEDARATSHFRTVYMNISTVEEMQEYLAEKRKLIGNK